MYCVKKIQDDLFWVGGSDRRLALFENAFPIPRGVSYNSYLLLDEKTVLFDTVDGAILDNFVEDVEARVLHHKIEGSGYPYRECVTRKGVDLLAYDRLFSQVVNDDYRTAIEIACDRLMYPVELENHLREQYEQYLEQNADVILKVLIPENKVEEISYLCASCLIPEAALADALPLASEKKMSQIAAILMEYQRSNFGKKKASTMSLDW